MTLRSRFYCGNPNTTVELFASLSPKSRIVYAVATKRWGIAIIHNEKPENEKPETIHDEDRNRNL